MNVDVISYTNQPLEVVYTACKTCVKEDAPITIFEESLDVSEEDKKKTIKSVIGYGHLSTLEHISFSFAIDGVSRACYDKDTEVLTNKGWKLFKDIEEEEVVATLSLNSNEVEFCKINEKIDYEYTGILHYYNSQNLDLPITPNHHLLFKKYDVRIPENNWGLEASENIVVNRIRMTKEFNYIKDIEPTITIEGYEYYRKNKFGEEFQVKTPNIILDRELFYNLFAWYLSDGSVTYFEKENKYVISISQTKCAKNEKNKTRERIKQLIHECGLTPVENVNSIRFNSLTLGRFFKELGLSGNKKIPFDIFLNFNKIYAQKFIEEYLKADGGVDKNNCSKLYTSSIILSDQLQILCFIAGYTAIKHSRYFDKVGEKIKIKGKICTRNFPSYVINIAKNKRNLHPIVIIDKHLKKIPYSDKVYCVNVKNNIIFVRKNGKAIWCGNCSHQLVRHRLASFSQQSQRYVTYNKDTILDKCIIPKSIQDSEYANNAFENLFHDIADLYERLVKAGFPEEDVRYILPNAMGTNLTMTMNFRELLNVAQLRLCLCSQWEIQDMFKKIISAIRGLGNEFVFFADMLLPKCEYLGYCTESKKKACGRKKHKSEFFKT